MEAHRGLGREEGHGLAELLFRKVSRVATDWHAEMPEMNPDLVRPAGERNSLDHARPVTRALDDAEASACLQSVVCHRPRPEFSWLLADPVVT